MSRRFLFTVCLVLLGVAFATSDVIVSHSISASSSGSSIHVKWVSQDETGVARFEVWRSAGQSNQFVYLGLKTPAGNGSFYDFQDDSAFRITDNLYQYQLVVVFTDGSQLKYPPVSVLYSSVSSVRRTWGSIKAMFR